MSTQERTPSLTTVDICYIHIHPDIQVRTMVSDDALERYTEIYKSGIVSLPPIKICISAETQEFFLIDGHHRLNAARAAGLKTIPALDYGEMTLAEMISESIRSNCEQGLALSKADRKRAAEMLAKYNPQITVRDAAQRVGLSKSLVATVLKEYREKTVVQCCECKATVLRLYAEDSTNGWVQVPETKRDRWFCCEDHRREFYAKQAEKEA
ncbi:ParB-like nuclease domain-containing protein, partial [bacterium]|nr:ParB-like nuclease domain-containing protein [bacterium]